MSALSAAQRDRLRQLPAVDRLLSVPVLQRLSAQCGHLVVVEAARAAIEQARRAIVEGQPIAVDTSQLIANIVDLVAKQLAPSLQPVINGTGVIIHTNLGRAPLSREALAAMAQVGQGYSNLEYDLEAGRRGSRNQHAARLICRLTNAAAAAVVNNAAAAVLLMLAALCQGREVIISRGQLIEIGGSFRMPDIMRAAGVKLVEVGTTNRTHLRDYAAAIGDNTAALLIVHPSNFRVVGFTYEPELEELAALAHSHGLPLLYDQGNGALLDPAQFGLAPERLVPAALAAGCDLVTFSGDKLLGGPQAGIICGRVDLIAQLQVHSLMRALRADKLILAALEATLNAYVRERALDELPIWQMLAVDSKTLGDRAERWRQRLYEADIAASVVDGYSTVGGGTLPTQRLATRLLAIATAQPDAFVRRLRQQSPPLIARIQEENVVIDPRSVLRDQEEELLAAIITASLR